MGYSGRIRGIHAYHEAALSTESTSDRPTELNIEQKHIGHFDVLDDHSGRAFCGEPARCLCKEALIASTTIYMVLTSSQESLSGGSEHGDQLLRSPCVQ